MSRSYYHCAGTNLTCDFESYSVIARAGKTLDTDLDRSLTTFAARTHYER